jgi:hypothetical protein
MCLLFACRDIPVPKLYDCADDDSDWWAWKDILQAKKLAYNGRLIRHKATLVSMQLLPAFYALYLSGGGHAMYEEEFFVGNLSHLANQVAEHLDRHGPTAADDLRVALVPTGKEHTRRFHSALNELQTKFKLVSVGLKDKSWGVRVLGLFADWVPSAVERAAERMPREEAIQRISKTFIGTAGAIPEPALPRMFGWTPAETAHATEDLVTTGSLLRGRIRGDRRTWLVSPEL